MKKIYSTITITLIFYCTLNTLSAQGWWYRKADCNLSARTAAVGFNVGVGGFIGTGFDSASFRRNFSVYNPANDTWTSVQSIGGVSGSGLSRDASAVFVINTKAYVVAGQGANPYLNDTWEYDAGSDVWTQKANFGGTPRRGAVGFSSNNKGFVTCGQDATGFKNDLWMYDPTSNNWTAKASFPGTARRLPVAFVISTIAYVGSGDDGICKKDFYQYNSSSNAWTAIATFPGTPRYGACAFVIGNDGYVGTGYDNTLANRKDFYKYNSLTNSWFAITDFAGTARSNAVAFSIGGYGYLATGYDSVPRNDLWKYDPLSNGIDEINKFKESVSVFPNPMSSSCTLRFNPESLNAFNEIGLTIYNVQGKLVREIKNINSSEISIERNTMSSGLYVYKIVADNHLIASGKIIVQ